MTMVLVPVRERVLPTRAFMLLFVVAALVAGFVVTEGSLARSAVAVAGEELTRLLRGMALLKAGMALLAGGAVLWRLKTKVTPRWFALYAMALGAMAAGPGLIWDMAYVRAGAVLLHGGLLASVLLVWRDPVVTERLRSFIRARRDHLRVAGGDAQPSRPAASKAPTRAA